MKTSINTNTVLGNTGKTSIVLPTFSYVCPDPDAVAFLSAAGVTDALSLYAVCTLVTDLKTAGLWTKMTAVYPFVGSTPASHKFNLINPADSDAAKRLVFNGGIIHSSTGALPNGVNGYANTFVNSDITNFPIPDYISFSYYSRTPGSHVTGGNVIGSFGNPATQATSARLLIRFVGNPDSSVSAINYPDGIQPNASTTTDTDGSGYYIGTRTSSASKLFIRGILRGSASGGTTTCSPPPVDMYLFAYSNRGISALNFTNKECAFAHIGKGLSDAECVTLSTIVDNFQTTLGRNV